MKAHPWSRRQLDYFSFPEPRSASMTRYTDSTEPVRGPSVDDFVSRCLMALSVSKKAVLLLQGRDDPRTPTKWTPRKNGSHLNTNNSNNNATTSARIATVKPARRDQGIVPNVDVTSLKRSIGACAVLTFRVFSNRIHTRGQRWTPRKISMLTQSTKRYTLIRGIGEESKRCFAELDLPAG